MTGRLVASLLSCLLVVAACGTADDTNDDAGDEGPAEPTPAETVDASALAGTWILVHADLDGVEPVWATDRSVTLRLDDGVLRGAAPCNGYGASVTIGSDGSVDVGAIDMNATSCGADLDAADLAYLDALATVTSISVEGDGNAFSFDGPGVTLQFMRDADGDGEPDGITSLDGEWIVDELRLDGERVALDPTYPITVTIEGEEIRGTAACNQFGGRLELVPDAGYGSLDVVDLFVTEMGCEPIPMQLEQVFLTVLDAVDSYEIADGVYVAQTGVGTNFHLAPVSPAEPAPLTGTTWVLDTYLDGDAASNWPGMELVHLTFTDDGALIGATACSAIDGEYVLDGDRLTIERLDRVEIPDRSNCDEGDGELDSLVLDVLEGLNVTATIDGDRLTIESDTSDGNRAGLSFQPGASAEEPDLDASRDERDLDPAGGVDGPVMYAERIDGESDQMGAQIVGALELDGDCLYTSSGGVRYPVLWPFGTTWNAAAETVVLPDGSAIALGDEVSGGGGYLHRGMTAAPAVIERIDRCAEEPYFEIAVLQSW